LQADGRASQQSLLDRADAWVFEKTLIVQAATTPLLPPQPSNHYSRHDSAHLHGNAASSGARVWRGAQQ
jgi:hypothetical protein